MDFETCKTKKETSLLFIKIFAFSQRPTTIDNTQRPNSQIELIPSNAECTNLICIDQKQRLIIVLSTALVLKRSRLKILLFSYSQEFTKDAILIKYKVLLFKANALISEKAAFSTSDNAMETLVCFP